MTLQFYDNLTLVMFSIFLCLDIFVKFLGIHLRYAQNNMADDDSIIINDNSPNRFYLIVTSNIKN